MVIRLSKTVRIKADDGRSFVLQKRFRKPRKDEAEPVKFVWKNQGYYSNLEQAAKGALRLEPHFKKKVVDDLQALIVTIQAAERSISEACQGAFTAQEAARLEGEAPDMYPADLFSALEQEEGG